MQAFLRKKFFEQFLSTAQERIAACQNAVRDDVGSIAAGELHSLAGEGSMLGFDEVAVLARTAEQEAEAWIAGDSAQRVKCGRSLRLITRALENLNEEAPSVTETSAAQTSTAKQKVLIVDDSLLVGEQLQDGLQAHNVEAHLTDSMSQALQHAREQQPTVMLVDANIPGVNTLELIAQLRTSTPTSRILLVSGLSDEDLRERATELHADGYISKREGLDAIVRGVVQVLAGSRP